jgi:hypothetical protein
MSKRYKVSGELSGDTLAKCQVLIENKIDYLQGVMDGLSQKALDDPSTPCSSQSTLSRFEQRIAEYIEAYNDLSDLVGWRRYEV